ncbi:hypothetical protein [Desulfomonile tiedjei]|uniref:Uncharacterized protein n=1 Tax=Desulfomonile tiedjei (strain ATCC 49306 / DSM 6799 / DCB-1) TaxID=706587 RepID=I4CCW8_DESTA|nr:hypothetical protein [Desulfomonile tiedjei]AFM27409.1 hypothetical protein Desti_4790 [Desulfomonile tiedjei DSM 6799]
MTAEIVIMNKSAVALAADSAVTSGSKIYSSVNKLFALSKTQPVGVMFYNYADFLGVPWESIIKIYRDIAINESFATLKEYFDHFLLYLRNAEDLFNRQQQQDYVDSAVRSYFELIKGDINEEVKKVFDTQNKISQTEINKLVEQIVAEHHQEWKSFDFVPDWSPFHLEDFIWQQEDNLDALLKEVLGNHSLSLKTLSQLKEIAGMLFAKNYFGSAYTGVVIAGFGEKETFPSLCSCMIEGLIDHKLKLRITQCSQISPQNRVTLVPFAQGEMVGTFMEGIEPTLREDIYDYVTEVFEEYPEIVVSKIDGLPDSAKSDILTELRKAGAEVSTRFIQRVGQVLRERYINPVIQATAVLPKDELASMAESLVNLTSIKRKFTLDAETVGGPVDVAVISKGDGFVWVKRKSYFEPHLNLRHYSTYFSDILTKWSNQNERTKYD